MEDGIKSAVLLEEGYFKTEADKEQYARLCIPDNFNLSEQQVGALGDVENNFLAPDYLTLNDCAEEERELINQVVERLQEVNQILNSDNLHVGYRVRDEVCFYMIYNQRQQLLEFDVAIDYQLQQKILSRIQGSSNLIKEILVELFNLSSGANLTADNRRVAGEALAKIEAEGAPISRKDSLHD
jgi:hypothetical protein